MNAPSHPRPASLADLNLDRSLLIDLTLKHVYTAGQAVTIELARRMGLPVDLLWPLFELMRLGGLIEPIDAGRRPDDRVWGLATEGRARAARALVQSRYVGPVPVTLDEYRMEVERERQWAERARWADLAALLKRAGLSVQQVDLLGAAFGNLGLIFVQGPSGSGKTHLLNALGAALEGVVRIPHAIAVGDRIMEVFDPLVHRPSSDFEAGGDRVDRRWVQCVAPVLRVGEEVCARMFDPRCDAVSGRIFAPLQIKANAGLLLVDDLDLAGARARALIGRLHRLLESGFDRLRFPDGTSIDLPVPARVVATASLSPEALGGEALVRRLAGRVELGEWPECAYRQWVEGLYRKQACESAESISGWLVSMHRAAGLPRLPGVAARLLQIAVDGARYRGEPGPLGRAAFERAWHVHRGIPGPLSRPSDPSPRRGTIPTPQHRRVTGSIDVRNRQPRQPA